MGVELDSSFHAKSRCRLKISENKLLTRIRGLSQIKTSWLRAFINHFQGDKIKENWTGGIHNAQRKVGNLNTILINVKGVEY